MRQIKNKKVPSTKVDGTFSTASQSFAPYGRERDSNPFSAAACTSPKILRVPDECESHSSGEEEQRND